MHTTEDVKTVRMSTLIFQGDDDQIVPYKNAAILQGKLVKTTNSSSTRAFRKDAADRGKDDQP
jgi:hypothetical protein